MPERPTLRGVVFDLDGTLALTDIAGKAVMSRTSTAIAEGTKECFQEIQERIQKSLTPVRGAKELVAWLEAHAISTALVTRNTTETALVLSGKFSPHHFDVVIGRDGQDSVVRTPEPADLYQIAEKWKLDPACMLMVGGSLENDVQLGKTVGTATCLVDFSHRYTDEVGNADIVTDNLVHLPKQMWSHFEIPGDLGTNTPLKFYNVPTPSNPVAQAAVAGDLSVLETSSDKDLFGKDNTGNTALVWAAENDQVDVLNFLLRRLSTMQSTKSKQAYLDTRGYLGATALCRAARRGHIQVLKLLVKAGADMDVPNDKMQFPLHFAAFKEHPKAVQVLLESGANTRVLDRKGRVPAEDTRSESIRSTILAAMQ